MKLKVDIAKALGLECYSHHTDEEMKSYLEDPDWYGDVVFTFNEKFFVIEYPKTRSIEQIWGEAADKIIDRLNNFITMEGFKEDAY